MIPPSNSRSSKAAELGIRAIAELNVLLGEAFAKACLLSLEEASVSPAEVDLIGSHGQTIYHHSGVMGARRATLQLGDGDIIAVRTGCYVISDFRARDIAAGGEGAPLSPIADTILFASRESGKARRRVILNLGGIANLTVLDADLNSRFWIRHRASQCTTRSASSPSFWRSALHVIKMGDLPGQDKSTKSFSANY